MYATLARNEKYGWFVIVTDGTSSIEISRCFQMEDENHAFRLLDILRNGLDVLVPLFKSGMHFQEFSEWVL